MKNKFCQWLLCSLAPFSLSAQCRQQDSLQLVALYNATNGPNWTNRTHWLTSQPIDHWEGVTTDKNGCVTAIRLVYNHLQNTIPNLNLPKLIQLDLSGNQLTGTIPLLNTPQLRLLHLRQNRLTGFIPDLYLPELVSLELSDNQLIGSIPYFNTPYLEKLDLSHNQLTGGIPDFSYQGLSYLFLDYNQLSGTIPNFNLIKLRQLYLSHNQLTNHIPLLNTPNLEILHLGHNRLTGQIPAFNMLELSELGLSENQLTGIITPPNTPNLKRLYLNDNQFSGSIPNFDYPNLIDLFLSSNHLTGEIPNLSIASLQTFHLGTNQLQGCIPASLKINCPRIGAAGGNLSNNPSLSTQNWEKYWNQGEGTCLSGWVDMHTHPMSHLMCGNKLMHGFPDGDINHALGNCNCTHGGWGIDNGCGNYIRAAVISKGLDKDFVHMAPNLHGDHYHPGIESNFTYWPHQTSKVHQQMWWEWIQRAYKEGGLRVMVALTVNSELLANVIDGDAPYDDKSTADRQIEALKNFVAAHNDFMEIAFSARDLRRIVSANKLAILIGMEIDNIGNFHKEFCNAETVKAEIRRLHRNGVRYVFPIHLIDNQFGGAAVYEDLFNVANKYSTGELYSVESSQMIDPRITHRLGAGIDGIGNFGMRAILDGLSGIPYPPAFHVIHCPFPIFNCWDRFNFIRNLFSPDPRYVEYAAISGGHVNAKGLTALGVVAIEEMMKLGMMIDVDHMSEKSVRNTIELALRHNYPVNMGHNEIRGEDGSERDASMGTAAVVAKLGGMFGVGTSNTTAPMFIEKVQITAETMANRNIAIGSDANGMELLPRTSEGLNTDVFYADFPRCQTGNRIWDYTTEGVAHYGLMADFMRDVQQRSPTVHANLMKSAEYFAQMWQKCEQNRPTRSKNLNEAPNKDNLAPFTEQDYKVYPNPTQNSLQVDCEKDELIAIEIFDMTGKCWQRKQVNRVKTDLIDVTMIPAGLYLLRLKTLKGEIVKKISILKP